MAFVVFLATGTGYAESFHRAMGDLVNPLEVKPSRISPETES
jgi:hypothetical protein